MKLTLDAISKSLNGKDLFTNFSLELQDGMKLCICGSNGVGKSVLIKMMAGREAPDKGNILYGKTVRIGYAEQELAIEDLTVSLLSYVQSALPDWEQFWQNWNEASNNDDTQQLASLSEQQSQWEQRYGYNLEHYCSRILFGLGFVQEDLNKSLHELSGGFRERAKLAKVIVEGSDILLLDEPINHLDVEAIEWLENFLLEYEGIIVFIAHDRVFMDTVSTHTLYIGGNKPFFRKGNYSSIMAQLEAIEEQKKQESQRIEKEIEDKMAFVERFRAKASKARQASSRQKMAKKLEKELETLAPEKKSPTLSFSFPTPHKAEKTLIVAEGVSKEFGERKLWSNLSFTIYNDSVVALVGSNGIGKSTLLKILLGITPPSSGVITRSSSLRCGYFSQHQSDILQLDATVLEEARRLCEQNLTEQEYMSVLGRFLLGKPYFDRPIASLSGGEKNRLILATIFLSKANLLILDEPTNHLDLETRHALTTALLSFQGAILLIAHDRYLLQQVAKEYWHITPHGITPYYSYTEYTQSKLLQYDMHKEQPMHKKDTVKEQKIHSKEDHKKQKQRKAQIRSEYYIKTKPLKTEYEEKENSLAQIYQRIDEIEITLSLSEIYNNPSEVEGLAKELHTLQKESNDIIEELSIVEQKLTELEQEYNQQLDNIE